jgi:hypothetical protein
VLPAPGYPPAKGPPARLQHQERERELLAASRAYESLGSLYGQAGLPGGPQGPHQASKYTQLLAVIEEIGKDIRPTYAGSKSSAERLKRGIARCIAQKSHLQGSSFPGIVHARILVREALMEAERSSRQ